MQILAQVCEVCGRSGSWTSDLGWPGALAIAAIALAAGWFFSTAVKHL